MDVGFDLVGLLEHHLHLALLLTLLVCSIGLPLPEEAVFLAVGYIARANDLSPWGVCAVGLAGILVGDLVPYAIGRHFGAALLDRPFFTRIFPPETRKRCEDFCRRRGHRAVFIARFIPALRTCAFTISGAMRMPILPFMLWDMLAGMISCPLAVCLAFYCGPRAKEWFEHGHQALLAIAAISIGMYVLLKWARMRARPARDN